jgi:WhiB family redox-sensing transcriptional regulator
VSDFHAYILIAVLLLVAVVIAWWSIRRQRRAEPPYPQRTVDQIFGGSRMNEWRHEANCRNQPPHVWFPVSRGRDARAREVAHAMDVCGECPVRRNCAQTALDTNATAGVWAGVDLGSTDDNRTHRKTRALRRIANETQR